MQVSFKLHDFERKAREFGATAKQVPYALATGMTWTMREAVNAEKAALPASFDRPTPFTLQGVGYTPATKSSLRFEVFIKDRQATYLGINVRGGTRAPVQAKTLAVPFVRRNAFGNVSRGTLKALAKSNNVFSGKPKGGNRPAGLWRRTNMNKKLGLLALYKPTLAYQKRFDFDGVFERTVKEMMPLKTGEAVQRVMQRFAARGP